MLKKYAWLIIIEQNGRLKISCCLFKGNSHVSSYYSTTTKLSTNVYQIPVATFFKMYILRTEPRRVSLRYYGSFWILYFAYLFGSKTLWIRKFKCNLQIIVSLTIRNADINLIDNFDGLKSTRTQYQLDNMKCISSWVRKTF